MFYCSDRPLQLTVSLPQHRQQIHFAQMQFEGLKLSHLQQLLVYSDWELTKEKRNQCGFIQSKMYRLFFSLIVAPCHLLLFVTSYPDFWITFGKANWFELSGLKTERGGVKLQCLTGEGKLGLVWIIRNFRKTEGFRNWEQKSFF